MKTRLGLIAFGLALAVLGVPCFIYSVNAGLDREITHQGYKEIHTEELKKLMDSKKPMLVLDARKKLSGGLLPGAKHLSYDADAHTIEKTMGSHSKDYMIVVYCARVQCPLSKYLAENLISAGYTNVYKYPEGIEEWMKTYPVDKIQ